MCSFWLHFGQTRLPEGVSNTEKSLEFSGSGGVKQATKTPLTDLAATFTGFLLEFDLWEEDEEE